MRKGLCACMIRTLLPGLPGLPVDSSSRLLWPTRRCGGILNYARDNHSVIEELTTTWAKHSLLYLNRQMVMTPKLKNTRLYPRWPVAPIRWQRTRVSLWQSWRFYLQLVPRFRDHTVFEFLTDLPGQDDVMVARLPFLRYVVIRSPELARYVLISNQDNYRKSAEYDMLAAAILGVDP